MFIPIQKIILWGDAKLVGKVETVREGLQASSDVLAFRSMKFCACLARVELYEN
jgi:hypothetical protein